MRQESPGLEIRIQSEDRNVEEDSSRDEDGTEKPSNYSREIKGKAYK